VKQNQFKRSLALIGVGYWGKNLARNFNNLGALHTVCDTSKENLNLAASEYGVKSSTNVAGVLSNPEITSVAIAAPAILHYRLCKEALLAGKDVFVEKPLCLKVDDAKELVELAEVSGRILMVGHLLQYHPCVNEIKLLVKSELGRLHYITSNRLNLGKIRKEENALWSFAPHDLSVILSLTGDILPKEVHCVGGAYLTPGVVDTTMTTMKFLEDTRAHVYVSWLNPFKEQKLTVVGSDGMLVFDDTKPWKEKLILYRKHLIQEEGKTFVPNKSAGEFVEVTEKEPLNAECEHFLNCCEQRLKPLTDGNEGLRVLKLLHLAQSSLGASGDE
tara:strand:+ start:11566 stop:12558 length:993 start_codon:yes stop_codon:yes gene_type:complete